MASFFQADSCGGFAGAFELGISEVGRADLGTEAPKQAEAYFGEAEGTTGGAGMECYATPGIGRTTLCGLAVLFIPLSLGWCQLRVR